jgi:hypothetical protein
MDQLSFFDRLARPRLGYQADTAETPTSAPSGRVSAEAECQRTAFADLPDAHGNCPSGCAVGVSGGKLKDAKYSAAIAAADVQTRAAGDVPDVVRPSPIARSGRPGTLPARAPVGECRKCHSREPVEVEIHRGRWTRIDCRKCGSFVRFGRWHGQPDPLALSGESARAGEKCP